MVSTEDWRRCRDRSARYASTRKLPTAICLIINASTERQWQGISRRNVEFAHTRSFRNGMMPIGIRTTTRLPAIVRAGCCRARIPACTGSATASEDCADGWRANAGLNGWQSSSPSCWSSSQDVLAGCGGDWGQVRSILKWRPHGWRRRSRKISATATPSRWAAPRSSAPAESASPCASATSSSVTATTSLSRPRRRPRSNCPARRC